MDESFTEADVLQGTPDRPQHGEAPTLALGVRRRWLAGARRRNARIGERRELRVGRTRQEQVHRPTGTEDRDIDVLDGVRAPLLQILWLVFPGQLVDRPLHAFEFVRRRAGQRHPGQGCLEFAVCCAPQAHGPAAGTERDRSARNSVRLGGITFRRPPRLGTDATPTRRRRLHRAAARRGSAGPRAWVPAGRWSIPALARITISSPRSAVAVGIPRRALHPVAPSRAGQCRRGAVSRSDQAQGRRRATAERSVRTRPGRTGAAAGFRRFQFTHASDHDEVVAGFVHLLDVAIDPGDGAIQDGCARVGGSPAHVHELVRRLRGERSADVLLVRS